MPLVRNRSASNSRFLVTPWISKEDLPIKGRNNATACAHKVVELDLVVKQQPEGQCAPGYHGSPVKGNPLTMEDSDEFKHIGHALRSEVWTGPAVTCSDCLIGVTRDGLRLFGLMDTGRHDSTDICTYSFTGEMVQSYRECMRDSDWGIVLLHFGKGWSPLMHDMTVPASSLSSTSSPSKLSGINSRRITSVHVLAERTGGDALQLEPPSLFEDEQESLYDLLGHHSESIDEDITVRFVSSEIFNFDASGSSSLGAYPLGQTYLKEYGDCDGPTSSISFVVRGCISIGRCNDL